MEILTCWIKLCSSRPWILQKKSLPTTQTHFNGETFTSELLEIGLWLTSCTKVHMLGARHWFLFSFSLLFFLFEVISSSQLEHNDWFCPNNIAHGSSNSFFPPDHHHALELEPPTLRILLQHQASFPSTRLGLKGNFASCHLWRNLLELPKKCNTFSAARALVPHYAFIQTTCIYTTDPKQLWFVRHLGGLDKPNLFFLYNQAVSSIYCLRNHLSTCGRAP